MMGEDASRDAKSGLSWEMVALIFGGIGIAAYAFKKVAVQSGEKEAQKQVEEKIKDIFD